MIKAHSGRNLKFTFSLKQITINGHHCGVRCMVYGVLIWCIYIVYLYTSIFHLRLPDQTANTQIRCIRKKNGKKYFGTKVERKMEIYNN